jgi:hypothetical protein
VIIKVFIGLILIRMWIGNDKEMLSFNDKNNDSLWISDRLFVNIWIKIGAN